MAGCASSIAEARTPSGDLRHASIHWYLDNNDGALAIGPEAVLFQGGAAPSPELKDVPFVLDLADREADRAAGNPANASWIPEWITAALL